jgi:hypothetical protein
VLFCFFVVFIFVFCGTYGDATNRTKEKTAQEAPMPFVPLSE